MLKQIKEVQDAWRATQRTLDIKVVINGKTYNATDINSLKYDSGAYTGDEFSIGSTYSNNVQIEFSHLVEGLKLGMEVHPSIGIKTSKGYIYEPLGVFIISSEIKMDRNNNLTSISASDRFCGLEGTYKSKLVYPAKVLDIVAEICAQSGVKANADDLARLPHQADIPIPISGQSYRKALGWIAQLYAGYATFDRQGLFTIRTIAEPNYELDPSQYEQAGLTKNEAPYKIGGIQCQTVITTKTRDGEKTEETKTYQVGDTSGSQIKLENNIMTPDRLNNIWEQIKDISFYPFNLNWFGNPAIEAGDWLRLEDKQGNKFIVPNNSYTLDFNGGLSATSKADQTSSTDSAISWRGTYAQIIEELQARRAPDGTVIFPPSVVEPPKNAKPNDVWFKQNGNSTELWVFTAQEDGSGKWVRRDLTPDEIKNQIQEAQSGLNDAKKQIADNLAKADEDIAELNASIAGQNSKIDGLNTSVNTVVISKVADITNQVSDVVTKVNEQENIVTGLQNQATQQGKDISKITTDVHSVTVDLANLNGDVNQTKATVQGLQTTLGNAQGDIAQIKVDAKKLSTSLSGKVDNSTYANFVNATNSALNARLVASDLNGYAKTTDVQATANGLQVNINSVADRMNNLKIGAENLLLNTADFKNYFINTNGSIDKFSENNYISAIINHPEITSYMRTWGDWQSAYSKQRVLLEKGKTYWFGFYACTDKSSESPCTRLNLYSNEDDNVSNAEFWGYLNVKDYSFWNKAKDWIWHAIKIVGDGKVYQNFRVEQSGNIGAGSVYIAGYTLVQSDVAPTGHTNSPYDLNHSINQVATQISQTAGTISTIVGKVNNLEIATNVQIVDHDIDLNTYKSTGTWFVKGAGTNAPESTWFYLDVKKASDERIIQTWQRDDVPTDRYTRTYSGSWSNWERSASYSEYSTLNQTVKGLQSTVSNNYTNLQSQISQTAGTIRSEITNKTTNLQSQITQNANNFNIRLQNATSGGGINLARNTSDIWSDSGWNNFNGASNQTKIITQVYFEGLHVGDWVTGYIEYQYQNLSGNDMYIYIQGFGNKTVWNGSQFGPSAQQLVASNDVKHGEFKFSFQLTEDMVYTWRNNYYNVQLRVDNAKGGWLQWNRIKFEKGTTATTWSPSPNDKVSKNKILAQINVAAGTTLLQNDKIYMDASSTVFSGKAFIPDAAITNISADKINTGTLDAGRINVINLNANNITTGTINGANLKINLNSGNVEFQRGRIHSSNNLLDINIDENYISTANWGTRALLKNGELQLTQANIFDTNSNSWYFRLYNGGGTGDAVSGASLIGRDSVTVSNKANSSGAMGFTSNPMSTADFSGLFTGKATTGWLPTILGGANRGVFIKAGTNMSEKHNILDPNDGGLLLTGSPYIAVGATGQNVGWWGNRVVIEGEYLHAPTVWRHTTGSAANVFVASDGALVRSTSASQYKTDIKRNYSTEYGEKLLSLPTATWTDKGQKERYEAGKRHIKPEKYFGMIAEDLADAGLDLLVSRNPETHEIEGIQYERIAPALLPVIKKLKDKVNRLEKQINE